MSRRHALLRELGAKERRLVECMTEDQDTGETAVLECFVDDSTPDRLMVRSHCKASAILRSLPDCASEKLVPAIFQELVSRKIINRTESSESEVAG